MDSKHGKGSGGAFGAPEKPYLNDRGRDGIMDDVLPEGVDWTPPDFPSAGGRTTSTAEGDAHHAVNEKLKVVVDQTWLGRLRAFLQKLELDVPCLHTEERQLRLKWRLLRNEAVRQRLDRDRRRYMRKKAKHAFAH